MRYSKKVAEAIFKSYNEKWAEIAFEGKRDKGTNDCALCSLCSHSCLACPMVKANMGCEKGPYRGWANHCRSRVVDSDTHNAAIDMMMFLMHLEQWYEITAER